MTNRLKARVGTLFFYLSQVLVIVFVLWAGTPLRAAEPDAYASITPHRAPEFDGSRSVGPGLIRVILAG